jgi:hypothetical protein
MVQITAFKLSEAAEASKKRNDRVVGQIEMVLEPMPRSLCRWDGRHGQMRKLPRTMLTLKKRTDTLCTLICQGASEYQLTKAAQKVRDARIRVLRAKIGEMPSVLLTAQQKRRIAKLSDQVESLLATTPMDFLNEFRRMFPKAHEDS